MKDVRSALSSEEKRALLAGLLEDKARQPLHSRLSPGQTRLWQLQSLEKNNPVYNISIAYRLNGLLDAGALEQAVRAIVHRHECLRTTFTMAAGDPVGVISNESPITLGRIDLRAIAAAERSRRTDELTLAEARTPFDLGQGPLGRFTLLELSDHEHVFQVTTHHIVSDRWSLGIIAHELGILYTAFATGQEPALGAPAAGYSSFARWQADWMCRGHMDQQLDFWKAQLRGPIPELRLPTDLLHQAAPSSTGDRCEFSVSPQLYTQIDRLAAGSGVTPYVVLVAGFAALLYTYSAQQDMLICVPVSGRHRPETRGIVGYFNNVLPLRLDLSGPPSFRQLLQQANQAARETFEHQDVPFQHIAELPDIAHLPFNRCIFSLQNTRSLSLHLPSVTSTYRDVPTGAADFDMAMFLEHKPEGLTGFIDCRANRFSKPRIHEILARFENLLLRLGDDPDQLLEEPPAQAHDPLPITRAHGTRVGSGPVSRGMSESDQAAASGLRLPRNELERRLIAIWQGFFPGREIERDSNFFELGGHSLLAARLFSRIGDLLGKDLPLALLLNAPTIAGLSNLLNQEGWTPSWSSLVPINTEGSRPPLFLVHAGGGNIISYRALSHYLGADQPVWGLQAQGVRSSQEPSYRIESIAESYLEAIRSRQSRGPYYLGGHSMGALIALEMAQQLHMLGEQVPFVAILDHAGPNARVGWIDWVRWQLICLSQLEIRDQWRFVSDRLRHKVRANRKLPNVLRRIAAGSLDKNDGQRKATWRLRQLQASLAAMENYEIRPYPGRIDLFRARLAAPRIHADAWGGWGQTGLGGVAVHEIPGHHMNMLDEPQVQVLATKIRTALDEARALAEESQAQPRNPCETTERHEPSTVPDSDSVPCERTPVRRA